MSNGRAAVACSASARWRSRLFVIAFHGRVGHALTCAASSKRTVVSTHASIRARICSGRRAQLRVPRITLWREAEANRSVAMRGSVRAL